MKTLGKVALVFAALAGIGVLICNQVPQTERIMRHG